MNLTFTASAVFELAMFGIMLLFLFFCGFFTFKHCFYIWRKKKRHHRRRHFRSDSLESVLDLLYNEDYYYLDSSTPYLPEDDESSSDLLAESKDTTEDEIIKQPCLSSTKERSVKWSGTQTIEIDKYKVCPQSSKPEDRRIHGKSFKPKLQRQTKLQLSSSSETLLPNDNTSLLNSFQTPEYPQFICSNDENITSDLLINKSEKKDIHKSAFEKAHAKFKRNISPKRHTAVPFTKAVLAAKNFGSKHRSHREQTQFTEKNSEDEAYCNSPIILQSDLTGDLDDAKLYRYDSETSSLPYHEKSSIRRNLLYDLPRKTERKVNFVDQVDQHKHKSRRSSGRKLRPGSSFTWFPKPHMTTHGEGDDGVRKHVTTRDSGAYKHADGEVEDLYHEYEQLEKKRYSQMLKKAKTFGRDNLPFFHRKHTMQ